MPESRAPAVVIMALQAPIQGRKPSPKTNKVRDLILRDLERYDAERCWGQGEDAEAERSSEESFVPVLTLQLGVSKRVLRLMEPHLGVASSSDASK
jgi:hypothetical protein